MHTDTELIRRAQQQTLSFQKLDSSPLHRVRCKVRRPNPLYVISVIRCDKLDGIDEHAFAAVKQKKSGRSATLSPSYGCWELPAHSSSHTQYIRYIRMSGSIAAAIHDA